VDLHPTQHKNRSSPRWSSQSVKI